MIALASHATSKKKAKMIEVIRGYSPLLNGCPLSGLGQPLDWNSDQLKVTNFADANQFTMRKYRQGWEVPGLSG